MALATCNGRPAGVLQCNTPSAPILGVTLVALMQLTLAAMVRVIIAVPAEVQSETADAIAGLPLT